MMIMDRATGNRRRTLSLAALAATAFAFTATAAHAAECPADKRVVDATKPVTTPAKGVSDKVLVSIDLSKETLALADHQLRLRKLVIEPGGIVPWHSHGDRPAIIYIIQGEIYEYASDCAVPILHKSGEATPEQSGTSHWWKNASKTTVILLSADILHDKSDHNM
jgi:quercetin dioxygenase-like cupin family protein